MQPLFLYILQVNLFLIFLFLGYRLLLRPLTFYQLNRAYLLLGSLYAFIYPLVDIPSLFPKQVLVSSEFLPVSWTSFMVSQPQKGIALHELFLGIAGLGALLFLLLLCVRFYSLWRVHKASSSALWRGVPFRDVFFQVQPFSFLNYIYIHKDKHSEQELEDIFKHELVHVKGAHSVELIVFELVLLVAWYNPVVWLLKKAVRQNLEFLTDDLVLSQGADPKAYQYSLLHVATSRESQAIGHGFNFHDLRARILMMNKKRSTGKQLGRYAFLVPVLMLAGVSLTVNKANARIENAVKAIGERQVHFSSPWVDVPSSPVLAIDTLPEKTIRAVVEVSPEAAKKDSVAVKTERHAAKRSLSFKNTDKQESPLYLIDGELSSAEELGNFAPEQIERIDVFKDEPAISTYRERFGDRANNGVVNIHLKTDQEHGIAEPEQNKSNKLSSGMKVRSSGLNDTTRHSNLVFRSRDSSGVLYVLDGQLLEKGVDLNTISPDDIASIEVLKAASAVELYGEKGRQGAVLIQTKEKK